jgi:hypothetical protein
MIFWEIITSSTSQKKFLKTHYTDSKESYLFCSQIRLNYFLGDYYFVFTLYTTKSFKKNHYNW